MEAKQVADMMEAYTSIYTQPEEQEVISEDPVQDYRDMRRSAENKRGDRGPELSHGGSSKGTPKPGSASITKQPRSREFSHGGSTPRSREFAHKEEVETDLFDYILEYLVAEGYADTNENALVIMANMSEDWRESIVESIARGSAPNSPTGTIGGAAGRVAGTLLQKGAELIKKNMSQSGGGYSTRPGDGKPYKDGPLWGPGSSDSSAKKPAPQRKPQGAPMRDEPLW